MVEFNANIGDGPKKVKKSTIQGETLQELVVNGSKEDPSIFNVDDNTVDGAMTDYFGGKFHKFGKDNQGRSYGVSDRGAYKSLDGNVIDDIKTGEYVVQNNDGLTIMQKDGKRYAIAKANALTGKQKVYIDANGDGKITASEEITDKDEKATILEEADIGSKYVPTKSEKKAYEMFAHEVTPKITRKEAQQAYDNLNAPGYRQAKVITKYDGKTTQLEMIGNNGGAVKQLNENGEDYAVRDSDGTVYIEKGGQYYKVTSDGKYYKGTADDQFEEITDTKEIKQLKKDSTFSKGVTNFERKNY